MNNPRVPYHAFFCFSLFCILYLLSISKRVTICDVKNGQHLTAATPGIITTPATCYYPSTHMWYNKDPRLMVSQNQKHSTIHAAVCRPIK